jgi:hypothetical protein
MMPQSLIREAVMGRLRKAAIELLGGDPPRRLRRRAAYLARVLALPKKTRLAKSRTRRHPMRVDIHDLRLALPRLARTNVDGPPRTRVAIWSVAASKELARCKRELLARTPKSEARAWALKWHVNNFSRKGGGIAIAASRNGTAAEGILLARRQTTVMLDAQTVRRAEYRVAGDYAFVVPAARGLMVATAMTAALCGQIRDDMDVLARAMGGSKRRVMIETRVSGDAWSSGGERILRDLVSCLAAYRPPEDPQRRVFSSEPERDFSL